MCYSKEKKEVTNGKSCVTVKLLYKTDRRINHSS